MSGQTSLRVIFMGTPDFAVPALEAVIKSSHQVVGVFTQPPRPRGRGQAVQISPVHACADRHKISVYTPASLKKDDSARAAFAMLEPDVAVVAAYGLILPPIILAGPRYGCLNIHASLLPRWRGASPIQRAIWAGDAETGICIMQMDEGLDTGAVVIREALPITNTTTAQSLHDNLASLGARMIVDALDRLATEGRLDSTPQRADGVTYAPLLTKDDGRIDWTQEAMVTDRQIRALTPWPGTWTITPDGRRLKILQARRAAAEHTSAAPGTIIDRTGRVACGGGSVLQLLTVQPENARAMDAAAAVNGGYFSAGDVFS